MNKIKELGQVFTKPAQVDFMINLRQHKGSVLEPFAGDGSFFNAIPECIGLELDKDVCLPDCINADFFDLPTSEKFDSIITNPPYVKGKLILPSTYSKIKSNLPAKTNLYVYCIEKMLDHLTDNGEMILLNPIDFLRTTSSACPLNIKLLQQGAITHCYDVSGQNIFKNANPDSCCIWRYQKGLTQGLVETNEGPKKLINHRGRISFVDPISEQQIPFDDVFYVKVGAVPGGGTTYFDDKGQQFVYSKTRINQQTKGMNYDPKLWIRAKPNQSDRDNPRIYVNCKTLTPEPFFIHSCKDWDGSVLAIFPINTKCDIVQAMNDLNQLDWHERGFMWHGKYVFTSGSLTNCMIPKSFLKYL